MANGNGNGAAYKIGMWLVGGVLVSILTFMGAGMIQADIKRAAEDQRIEDKMAIQMEDKDMKCEQRSSDVMQEVKELNDDVNENFRQLFVEVGKIQAKMQ